MGQPTADNLYFYNPSHIAAVIFTILYGILVASHFYLCVIAPRKQTYKHRYTIPLLVATLLSTGGYGVRVASINQLGNILLYAVSSSFIVVAPVFVCATLYLLVARLVRLCLPEGHTRTLFCVTPQWLGRIFVISDVFSFLTQCAGSGIVASSNWQGDLKTLGSNVLLFGLILQMTTFSFFLVITRQFVRRVHSLAYAGFNPCVRKVLAGLWVASVFVQIRTIYRVIEFALGVDGYPFQHEWCLHVLESVPMFIALSALVWRHPVQWLQQRPRFEFAGDKENHAELAARIRRIAGERN